jgi:hypothetical protein
MRSHHYRPHPKNLMTKNWNITKNNDVANLSQPMSAKKFPDSTSNSARKLHEEKPCHIFLMNFPKTPSLNTSKTKISVEKWPIRVAHKICTGTSSCSEMRGRPGNLEVSCCGHSEMGEVARKERNGKSAGNSCKQRRIFRPSALSSNK